MKALLTIAYLPVALAVACWFLACAFVEVALLGRNPSLKSEGDE